MQYAERFVQEFRPASVVADDTEVAHAFRVGDEGAVRELVRRYGGPVFVTVMHMVGDRVRADEATRQTFVRAWQGSDRFEPGHDFGPWLASIARRCALELSDAEERSTLSEVAHADESDRLEVEAIWSVRRAIDALDPEERDVVRRAHLDGRTHAQTAEHLGVSIGTVNARSYRAHRRLVNRLGHLHDLHEEHPR